MKIISDTSLENFDAWSGAVETKNRIIEENKESEFEAYVEELYPDGLTDTELNDLLWFEEESIFEWLGIHDYTCAECGDEPVENDGDLCDDCQALEDEEFENEESDDE